LIDQKRFWEITLLEIEQFAIIANYQFDNWASKSAKDEFVYSAKGEILKLDSYLAIESRPNGKKLVWLRKPSEFGYLFCQLIEGGYIQDPSGMKMSPKQIAEFMLEHFEFKQGTTIQTLTKAITTDAANLGDKTYKKLKIPHSEELERMIDKKPK
jgi:hypothetical protein